MPPYSTQSCRQCKHTVPIYAWIPRTASACVSDAQCSWNTEVLQCHMPRPRACSQGSGPWEGTYRPKTGPAKEDSLVRYYCRQWMSGYQRPWQGTRWKWRWWTCKSSWAGIKEEKYRPLQLFHVAEEVFMKHTLSWYPYLWARRSKFRSCSQRLPCIKP